MIKNKKIKVLLLGVGLICFWRGVWHTLDEIFNTFLFPDFHLMGNLVCIALGLIVVFFTEYDNF